MKFIMLTKPILLSASITYQESMRHESMCQIFRLPRKELPPNYYNTKSCAYISPTRQKQRWACNQHQSYFDPHVDSNFWIEPSSRGTWKSTEKNYFYAERQNPDFLLYFFCSLVCVVNNFDSVEFRNPCTIVFSNSSKNQMKYDKHMKAQEISNFVTSEYMYTKLLYTNVSVCKLSHLLFLVW